MDKTRQDKETSEKSFKKKEEEKKIIVYKEDNGETVSVRATIEEINNSCITFLTNTNKITIPIHRLLKIKESLEENGR